LAAVALTYTGLVDIVALASTSAGGLAYIVTLA
jgi:hypothetical protein